MLIFVFESLNKQAATVYARNFTPSLKWNPVVTLQKELKHGTTSTCSSICIYPTIMLMKVLAWSKNTLQSTTEALIFRNIQDEDILSGREPNWRME